MDHFKIFDVPKQSEGVHEKKKVESKGVNFFAFCLAGLFPPTGFPHGLRLPSGFPPK